MNLPTLRQLQYLVAVVELKHFGQAAQRCCVTQSTLSAGIQELEELLGAVLLERDKRKVMPTPLGEELAAHARHLLEQAAWMVARAHSGGEALQGRLRLGVIPTIGPFLLPKVLPAVRRAYPHLHLQLREDQSARLLEQLENGLLDAAVLAFPFAIKNLAHEIFWEEDFMLALPAGHALSVAPRLSSENLPQDELLLLEEGHCLTDHALNVCRLARSGSAFQGTSLYTLLQMVAGGQGMTFVPEMAVTPDLLSLGEITLVRLAEPGPHRRIGLVWRPTYPYGEALRTLAHTLAEALSVMADTAQT
jgi:LysR family transcriptional regulator, hydrogen peroxide-inducible genes activator